MEGTDPHTAPTAYHEDTKGTKGVGGTPRIGVHNIYLLLRFFVSFVPFVSSW
jgi:hypothetical protein